MKTRRFADAVVFGSDGNPIEFIQVGRQTKGGLPVSRERQAIGDIINFSEYGKVPIKFIPYN